MRAFALLPALLLSTLQPVAAQEAALIGVAAPLSGPSAILGRQIAAGVGEAAGDDAEVIAADTQCSASGGQAAARQFVQDGVSIVVGFLCTAEIEAALPILTEAGIPVIDVGVRANRLTDRRERTGHLVWRVAPRTDDEADALAVFVRDSWRNSPFGIVDDGSVNARDLSDEIRARLGPQSIEPALVDDYRPAEEVQFALARRILQSGVTRLLILGSRSDAAIVARDARELGLELEIVGGELLIDEPGEGLDLPSGTRAVAVDPATANDTRPPAAAAPLREGYQPAAFAATQIALQAIGRAGNEGSLVEALDGPAFDTILGPIGFDAKGDSSRDAFQLLEWDGAAFRPAPQS